jgi:Tol biopolymer transport system component
MQKTRWRTYAELETLAMNEIKERNDFPDRLKLPRGNLEDGISNGQGWRLQGFIEDADGRLRPQTFEETASCIGCHGGIGATTDSTFALARKLDAAAFQEGWFHWSRKDLRGAREPKVAFEKAGVQYEYAFYLMYSLAGDEFRANAEVLAQFFDARGFLKPDMANRLHDDIGLLLYPSPKRAIALNKTYRTIVAEQSFPLGRDPITGVAENVHQEIQPADTLTRVTTPVVLARLPRDVHAAPDMAGQAHVVPRQMALISGDGMAGPNGQRYQIDDQGLIDESQYALKQEGYYFPFPPRHTLPTRVIVPNADIPACYACHRLDTPMPPAMPKITVPVPLKRTKGDTGAHPMTRLTADKATDVNAVWHPKGHKIAWVSNRSGRFQIWTMNTDGSDKQPLTRGPAVHGWPMWSPDGDRLVYWGHDPQSGRSTITVSSADGRERLELMSSPGALDRPVWRPDGNYIAYAAQEGANWDIWVVSADGRKTYRLTHDAQMETNPLWSPDGMTIGYKVAPNKAYNLTIENFISVENGLGNPTYRIWDGIKSIQMNAWSPDGKRIAYTAEAVTNASGKDRVSYLAVVEDISLSGSRTSSTPIVLSRGLTLGDRGPVFSPTGDRVAFWAWDRSYQAGLWLAAVDGSETVQLTSGGADMYPQFSPDGQRLAFESGRSGNLDIWVIDLK